jgi:hypothetical protein
MPQAQMRALSNFKIKNTGAITIATKPAFIAFVLLLKPIINGAFKGCKMPNGNGVFYRMKMVYFSDLPSVWYTYPAKEKHCTYRIHYGKLNQEKLPSAIARIKTCRIP